MTIQDVFTRCVELGDFPEVVSMAPIKGASSRRGKVTVIKDNGTYKGIAVRFEGMNYDKWFWDDMYSSDQRTLYMRQLRFVVQDE